MIKILVATGNKNKIKEFNQIINEIDHKILEKFSFETATNYISPPESGKSFEENALIKAQELAEKTNQIVISDDSGIEIEALNGMPGVYSADWAGEDRNFNKAFHAIDVLLGNNTNKNAKFTCVLCLYIPQSIQGSLFLPESLRNNHCFIYGETKGYLTTPKGEQGFAYDKIFICNDFTGNISGKTFAEVSMEIKNKHSHRKKAILSLIELFIKPNI